MDCGFQSILNLLYAQLRFGYENLLDRKYFVIFIILQVKEFWAKVKTSAKAYSPNISAHFRMCDHIPIINNA